MTKMTIFKSDLKELEKLNLSEYVNILDMNEFEVSFFHVESNFIEGKFHLHVTTFISEKRWDG